MSTKQLCVLSLGIILCSHLASCDDEPANETAAQAKTIQLQKVIAQVLHDTDLTGKYKLSLTEKDIPKNDHNWYLFAVTESNEDDKYLGEPTQITFAYDDVSHDGSHESVCKVDDDWDSCFVDKDWFGNKPQNVTISVECPESCSFSLNVHVGQAKKLDTNGSQVLLFKDPSTQIFSIEIPEMQDSERFCIMLRPALGLSYPEPVEMYAKFGQEIPTENDYDLKAYNFLKSAKLIAFGKDQAKQKSKLILLIESPQSNSFLLIARVENQQELYTLTINDNQNYEYLKENDVSNYLIDFKGIRESNTVYLIVEIYNGQLKPLQFYEDEEKKKPITIAQADEKYKIFSYVFSPSFRLEHKLTKMYMTVNCKKTAIFFIQMLKSHNSVLPVINHAAASTSIEEGENLLIMMTMKGYIGKQESENIEVIFSSIEGDFNVTFYKCVATQKNTSKCEVTDNDIENNTQFKQIEPKDTKVATNQKRYWFDLPWPEADKQAETQNKRAQLALYTVIGVLENTNEGGESTCSILFKNKGKITQLFQNDLKYDNAASNEKNHYFFSVIDKKVTHVRIHVNKISGMFNFAGMLEDPRVNKYQQQLIQSKNNVVTFDLEQKNIPCTLYLEVEAQESSIFDIMTQVIRSSESDSSGDNDKGYNELVIFLDVPYQFVLAPDQKLILQLRPQVNKFIMSIKSTLPLDFCATETLNKPPFAPNCQVRQEKVKSIYEEVTLDRGLIANIGVTNNNDRNVSLRLKIAVEKQKCESASFGKVMQKYIRENSKTNCLTYILNKVAPIEVTVQLENLAYNKDLIEIKMKEQKIRMTGPVHRLSAEQVRAACGQQLDSHSNGTDFFCYLEIMIENVSDTKVHIIVQYTDSIVILYDGFSHSVHSQMLKNEPKMFYYSIINNVNTTIFLENKVGEYQIYASIVSQSSFKDAQLDQSKLFPNNKSKQFQSFNPFFDLEQTITISGEDVKSKCDLNLDCAILISVYYNGDQELLPNGKFVIECTQQNRMLSAGKQLKGYLSQESIVFYSYVNEVENGTIVVSVNNQNKKCVNIYLLKGVQKATKSNNDVHTQASNTLFKHKAQKQIYSIALQAIADCLFTVEVLSSNNSVMILKKGAFSDIQLEVGETANFLFENLINETFKILSVQQEGQVMISVKSLPSEFVQEQLLKDIDKISDWVWVDKDSVEIAYVERGGKISEYYCFDCYYLIHINANRKTKASVMIPTPGTEIPLTTDALIKDIMQQDQETVFRVFTGSDVKFQLRLPYGKINMTVTDSQVEGSIYSKVFESKNSSVIDRYSMNKNESYDFLRYSRIRIKALEESFLVFGIISSEDPQKRGGHLEFGIPQYLYLDKGKQKCISATINKETDKFLLSFDSMQDIKIEDILISLKKNNTSLLLNREEANREVVVSTRGRLEIQGTYDLCVRSQKQSIAVTVIQSSPVIYLPENKNLLVTNQLNVTFRSEGRSLLEVNECIGRMITGVYSEFGDLKSSSSQISQNRKRNNIVDFFFTGPLFVSLQAKKGSVRWFQANDEEGLGMGYEDYKSGWLRLIKGKDNKLQVSAQKIQSTTSKTRTSRIQSVTYNFYAAKEEMQLYNAMNCESGAFIQESYPDNSPNQQQPVKIVFDIQTQLKPLFSKYSYFLIGLKADVQLLNSKNAIENYRFYYPYQEVTRQILNKDSRNIDGNGEEREADDGSTGFLFVVFLVAVALVCLLGIWLLYTRLIRKYIRRQRISGESGTQMRYTGFQATD